MHMNTHRTTITIKGAVQGVGFRPFVYRVASALELRGWVRNNPAGVEIEVEGPQKEIGEFVHSLKTKRPPLAIIQSIVCESREPIGYRKFEIRESTEDESRTVLVTPDIATCEECLGEIGTEGERRYFYPFTNCTNCGPRFTIIERLPYDRPNTTMKGFKLCTDCQKEYENPKNRRFHAQPIACPVCGPQVSLMNSKGKVISVKDDALRFAARAVRAGSIVAIKGLGGFLLVCDAKDAKAIEKLRERKYREEKPFALMYPDIECVKRDCMVSPIEEDALLSPQRPIVLLRKKGKVSVAENVAPSNPYLGVMLPYAPIHHLLVSEVGSPIIATSGNRTDDPIAMDNDEALDRLKGIADYFLMHDRPIMRRVDDSVVRIFEDKLMVLRRARGYAPLPIPWKNPKGSSILALGAHLKSTIGFSKGDNIFVSQHIGDLETREAIESFKEVISSLEGMYEFEPSAIAVDLHPGYVSTKIGEELAEKGKIDIIRVQHHHAHVASCMCENGLDGSVLGIAWDGVGYGSDGEAWGSEFLIADHERFVRFAHFLPFPLPGGEGAVRKVSHSGLGALYTTFGDELFDKKMQKLPTLGAFSEKEQGLLVDAMKSGINSPNVYGAGRFFDAVASIIGIRQECSFEAQAAMQLEFAGTEARSKVGSRKMSSYPYELKGQKPIVIDWRPMIKGVVEEHRRGVELGIIALKMHQTLADVIVEVAGMAGEKDILLTGGVFQNALLGSLVYRSVIGDRFKLRSHSLLPPNDGCISVGQTAVALAQKR